MNRLGQLLLVFGVIFIGLVAFDVARKGMLLPSHKYEFIASAVAVVAGALLLRMSRGSAA
jgi:hypothetical protein